MSFLTKILLNSQQNMPHPTAMTYLEARGVTAKQALEYGIGYYPEESWPPYIKDASSQEVRDYLQWSSKGFRLRGKLLFPMHNAVGALTGIQIRSPNPEVKDYSKFYLPRSKVDAIFFGVTQAMPSIWETREVYLVEGLFDLFPMQRVFPNTICTGTARIDRRQVEFLLRYVDDVVIAFDTDWRGNQTFSEFVEMHESAFTSIRRLTLGAKDISDAWASAASDQAFQQRLQQRLL